MPIIKSEIHRFCHNDVARLGNHPHPAAAALPAEPSDQRHLRRNKPVDFTDVSHSGNFYILSSYNLFPFLSLSFLSDPTVLRH